ncbi:MAG TPA: isoprenylcysteine carboxylmethyltransferase family protein [Hyphomicrobiaceae bacterium]|nr:isoprenylcysteine carboxylmethyltransferase family protein [Hyphomicrobiaceae bacterium]
MSSVSDSPGVVARPPLIYLATLMIALALEWLRPLPLLGHAAIGPGVLAAVAGIAIAVWGRQTMLAAGTNVDPTLPSTAMVTAGPFRFCRNPLYLGLTLLYLGITLAVDTWWGLIALVPLLLVMHVGVVLREEHYLEAKFGDQYRSYKMEVARYVPFVG